MALTKLIALAVIMNLSFCTFAEYEYKFIEQDGHRIHIVTIDPSEYETSIISAHDQVFGRERVGDIAKRENAVIAVNSGFFQIGDIEDGRPTGTLVNDAEIFGMRITQHGCFVKKEGELAVEILQPALEVVINAKKIKPLRFNKFAQGRNIFYFSRAWGPSTLSEYNSRQEIIFDAELKILDVSQHGNNKIPENGYVLSFPKTADLNDIKVGDQASFNWTPNYFAKDNSFAVMGLPVLVLDNQVRDALSNGQVHARTAIGLKKDGNVALVVVEHAYKKNMQDVTLQEVKKIMEKRQLSFSNVTASDVKKIIFEDLTSDNNAIGMGILELAEFMHNLGCVSAINLDGGGSSSLYIAGKYINESIGDSDEGAGQITIRPVSDAIVFKRK